MDKYHKWTNKEKKYVVSHFGKVKQKDIASHLGLTEDRVKSMGRRLGLKTPDSIILARRIEAGIKNLKSAGFGVHKCSTQLKKLKSICRLLITLFPNNIEKSVLKIIIQLDKRLNVNKLP